MRIICTLSDQKQGQSLSAFLSAEGIENQLEVSIETDWGSPKYGDMSCQIWIVDEDKVSAAQRWVDLFKKDPEDPVFHELSKKRGSFAKTETEAPVENPLKLIKTAPAEEQPLRALGKITFYLLLICSVLYFATEFTDPQITSFPPSISPTPLFSSPLKKNLLYDYPRAFEIIDKLVGLYGIERLQNPGDLPPEGQYLLKQYFNTPYWTGFYDVILSALRKGDAEAKQKAQESLAAPLFEKLQEGEAWRLFSPCLLHSGILHIVFNMMWLIVLGRQMESRLGSWRYIIFILVAGIFSNTAQYLMGGANFIGISGVLCAMLTFVWVRQKIAAWEGYQLEGMAFGFVMIFIASMFAIQLISFYLETQSQAAISPGIANTAHLSGAAIGYFLGRLPFFSWKP